MFKGVQTNRIVAFAVLPVAFLALAGCGLHPGVAADVGGTQIRTSDVDLLTSVECREAANQKASNAVSAISAIRRSALTGLIDAELNEKYAASVHATYDKSAFHTQMAQFEALIDTLPASEQSQLRTILAGFTKGQLEISAIGEQALLQQGTSNSTAQQQSDAGYQLRSAYARKLKITLDPAYGLSNNGAPEPGVASLSKPVSSFAVAAAKAQPSASWVAGLAAPQKCG